MIDEHGHYPEERYPKVEHLPCGCIRNIYEDTIRTDFCDYHAKQETKK
jgi:hypothetical protein